MEVGLNSIPIDPISLCPRKRRTLNPENDKRQRRRFNPENVETVIFWEKQKNLPGDRELFLKEQNPVDDLNKNDYDKIEIVEVKLSQKRSKPQLDLLISVEQSAIAAEDLLPGKMCDPKIDDGLVSEFISVSNAVNEVPDRNLVKDNDMAVVNNAPGLGFSAEIESAELKNDMESRILSMDDYSIVVEVISGSDEVQEFDIDKDGGSSKITNTSGSDIPVENDVAETVENEITNGAADEEIPADQNKVPETADNKEVTKVAADKEVTESILVNDSNEKGRKMVGDGINIEVISVGQEVDILNKERILEKIEAINLNDAIWEKIKATDFVGTFADYEVPESILVSHDETRLKMVAGSHYMPKQSDPLKPLGEDAHFIHYNENGIATIGVADGVGGWSKHGIDSGIYARELMDNAIFVLQAQESSPVDPKQILHAVWTLGWSEGASTACIVTLQDNFLHAVNLGDSGFMVIRDRSKVVYKSLPQQKSFNCPFQLGKVSGTGYSPNDADEIKFQVENGDVLVAATDGLFDNLFPDEIARIVETCLDSNKEILPPAGLVAQTLALFARQMSYTRDSVRPWTVTAAQAGRDFQKYKGGKYDDTTVVVGYIGDINLMKDLIKKPSLSVFH